jgi:hypothetical protein
MDTMCTLSTNGNIYLYVKTLRRHLFCFNYAFSYIKFANIIYTVTSTFNAYINGRVTQYRLLFVLAKDSPFFLFLKLVQVNITICRQCTHSVHVIRGSFINNENVFLFNLYWVTRPFI